MDLVEVEPTQYSRHRRSPNAEDQQNPIDGTQIEGEGYLSKLLYVIYRYIKVVPN